MTEVKKAEVIVMYAKDEDGRLHGCVVKELVRCKDCIKKDNPFRCRLDRDLEEYGGHRTELYDYWFCADGEKKEGTNNGTLDDRQRDPAGAGAEGHEEA